MIQCGRRPADGLACAALERRLAAAAAVGLFATLFLPWYRETVIARGLTSLRSLSQSMTGWGAFSFVEAAVLLVAAGVLLLLFVRAEGEAFHVPGGDGSVITAAGAWACVLIIWRMFDKEGTTGHGLYSTSSGIEWGIFVALAVAGLLTYTGTRIRQAHEPEPPLPGERPRRRPAGRKGDQAERGPSQGRSTATGQETWAAADDIEEMWLSQERDRPASKAPPPPPDPRPRFPRPTPRPRCLRPTPRRPLPPADATAPCLRPTPPPRTPADATAPAPPDATRPLPPPDATAACPPADAAPLRGAVARGASPNHRRPPRRIRPRCGSTPATEPAAAPV